MESYAEVEPELDSSLSESSRASGAALFFQIGTPIANLFLPFHLGSGPITNMVSDKNIGYVSRSLHSIKR